MKFDWMTVLKLLAALVISGFVWTQDNQLALLTIVSIVVVWGVKFYANRTQKKVGKLFLTSLLLVLSVGCALLFQGFALPAFPVFDGDVLVFAGALIAWAGALISSGSQLFAYATGLYNILLADVLKKLEETPMFTGMLKRLNAKG